MLVTTLAAIASRCPICGKPDAHSFSLFSTSNSTDIRCNCGFHKLTIGIKDYKYFHLQIPCHYCSTDHVFYVLLREFISSGLVTLTCPATDHEIAFMGKQDKIEELFPDIGQESMHIDELVKDFGCDEYFSSPDIMLELLNHFCQLAENEKIACECGNTTVGIDAFEEKISLTCESCGASDSFQAVDAEDTERIKNMESIIIGKKSFKGVVKLSHIRYKNGDKRN